MKSLLFENVKGNQFKLIKEAAKDNESLIASGLKKVFSTMDESISYQRVEAVGLSYIKDITEAKRISLDEAKNIAKQYGYADLVNEARFVKEEQKPNPETDMSNPEEAKEVQIARKIIAHTQRLVNYIPEEDWAKLVTPIQALAKEILTIHGQQ